MDGAPLSPTEELLLQHIRAGAPDAEIAVRLGLSNGEVKRRIEVLCAKVGVPDRAGLRAPPNTAVAPAEPVEEAEDLQEPIRPALLRVIPALVSFAAIVLVAGVALLFLVAGRGGGDAAAGAESEPAATATLAPIVTSTPAPSVSATPVTVKGITALPITSEIDTQFDLFDASALVTVACVAPTCDSYNLSLARVTRPRNLPSTSTYEPITLPDYGPSAAIIGVASDRWGWQIAVSLCMEEAAEFPCDERSDDAHSVLLLSEDGGVTWREVERYVRPVRPIGISREGIITQRPFQFRLNQDPVTVTRVVRPDGSELDAPGGPYAFVGVLPDGRATWAHVQEAAFPARMGGGALVGIEGTVIRNLGLGDGITVRNLTAFDDETMLVTWNTSEDASDLTAAILTADGQVRRAFTGSPFYDAVPLSSSRLLGTGQEGVPPNRRLLPAAARRVVGPATPVGTLSLDERSLLEVRRFFELEQLNHRNLTLEGIRQGPHLRVLPETGTECLPARDQPSFAATEMRCFAPGVLLWDPGYDINASQRTAAFADDTWWVRVSWPGVPGSPHEVGWVPLESVEEVAVQFEHNGTTALNVPVAANDELAELLAGLSRWGVAAELVTPAALARAGAEGISLKTDLGNIDLLILADGRSFDDFRVELGGASGVETILLAPDDGAGQWISLGGSASAEISPFVFRRDNVLVVARSAAIAKVVRNVLSVPETTILVAVPPEVVWVVPFAEALQAQGLLVSAVRHAIPLLDAASEVLVYTDRGPIQVGLVHEGEDGGDYGVRRENGETYLLLPGRDPVLIGGSQAPNIRVFGRGQYVVQLFSETLESISRTALDAAQP